MQKQNMQTEAQAGGNELRRVSLADFLAHPFQPREHLIAPWLRQGESAMIYAPSGLGKTMLTLTIALAVAGGGEVLGWRAEKPRRVLLVDGEMNAQDLQERLKMLSGTVSGWNEAAAGQRLHLLIRQHQPGDGNFPDLATVEGQNTVLAQARAMAAELVVIDNLTTCAKVSDENSTAAMAPVLEFLMRLKQAGIGCVLVHHSGKSATATYRGSSALATTFEAILGLKAPEGNAARSGAGFEMRWEKFRGAPSAATRDCLAELIGESPVWRRRPAAHTERAALVEVALSGEFRTSREIAAHLGWSTAKVSREKAAAIRAGEITEAVWRECLETLEAASEVA